METDGDDFAAFAAAEFPRLLRFGHLLSGDRTTAEDLVQTALARTHLHWPRLRDRDAAPAYVRQAMVRQQANRWNRLLSRERTVAHLPERADPASAYDGVDDRDAMWAALARLAPRQRAVLVLRYYEQLSEAEIAGVLGCSTGTVKSQASKGLARLRVQLTPERTEVAP